MHTARPEEVALLFREARTQNGWLDRPVDDTLLHQLHELTRMGPTLANSQPLRLVFVKSPEGKAKLLAAVSPGNVEKTRSAPVTAIVAYDVAFHEKLKKTFPPRPEFGDTLAAMPLEVRTKLATQSSHLQAGYLVMAARALGLDVGPMGGFDAAKVDEAFFPDGAWKTTLLMNLGYGDPAKLHPRLPRLEFDEVARIA